MPPAAFILHVTTPQVPLILLPRPKTSPSSASSATTRPTPQVPLILLPLPNVTIYYSVWRVASNHSAANGAKALLASLDAASDVQRYELAAKLAGLQAAGVKLRPGEWPERLVQQLPR